MCVSQKVLFIFSDLEFVYLEGFSIINVEPF